MTAFRQCQDGTAVPSWLCYLRFYSPNRTLTFSILKMYYVCILVSVKQGIFWLGISWAFVILPQEFCSIELHVFMQCYCVHAVLLSSLLVNSGSVSRSECHTSATLRGLTWMNRNRIPIIWRMYLNFCLKSSSIVMLLDYYDSCLDSFAKLRKAIISFDMSVCPTVFPHGTSRLPLVGFH